MLPKKNHLLVVDDDNINIFIIKKTIEKSAFDIEVMVKNNGQEALDYLKNLLENHQKLPNIILTDINMPIMNGWELIDHCVALGITHQTNLYVLSSSVYEEDLERAKKYENLKGFISKPLTFERLSNLIQEIEA